MMWPIMTTRELCCSPSLVTEERTMCQACFNHWWSGFGSAFTQVVGFRVLVKVWETFLAAKIRAIVCKKCPVSLEERS